MVLIHGFGLLPLPSEASGKIHSPSTSAFRFPDALKVITFRAAIGAADACLRIASRALALLAHGEFSKAAKVHVFPERECGDDFFEDSVNQFLGLTARDARTNGIDGMGDFPLRQRPLRLIS